MEGELEKQISEWLLDRFAYEEGCNPFVLEPSLKRIIDNMRKEFPTLESLERLLFLVEGVNDEYPDVYIKDLELVKDLIKFFKKWIGDGK